MAGQFWVGHKAQDGTSSPIRDYPMDADHAGIVTGGNPIIY